ncbi:FecR family protein [Pinibacter aurantiacus]|uniref:FecR family protein n=1 Tax=Pinibacter aurantiacus TaxID=2851599 RepID=A0A9E2W736_9BACT|nr:FecR family protein [Pinibacter aurantiacus]MBV4360558.1 FecR family protein [Pinibacter aurantiacus]
MLKLSGEANEKELEEFDQAVRQFPALSFQLEILEKAWHSKTKRNVPDVNSAFNRHLQRLSNHLSEDSLQYETEPVEPAPAPPTQRRSLYKRVWFIGATAAAACVIAVTALIYKNHPVEEIPNATTAQNLVSTRNGSKTKLTLPDGTQVWLNSGSNIAYGNDLNGPTRQVTLKGEAYFDVARDVKRPFIIHTDAIDIKVLGTAFNVRSYPDEKITETSLIKGSVEITLKHDPNKKIILNPSEKLIVKNDSAIVADLKTTHSNTIDPVMSLTNVHYVDKSHDSLSMETLWTKNKLVFDGETLEQVALKLERWYGVSVNIQSDKLKKTQYNGVFDNENIDEVLYALKLSGDFNYTIRKNEVTIKP